MEEGGEGEEREVDGDGGVRRKGLERSRLGWRRED